MSKRKAFWGEGVRKQIGALVNDQLLDAEVNAFGIKFFKRGTSQEAGFLTWKYAHSVACQKWTGPRFEDKTAQREAFHGKLNESAGLRIMPAEEE